MRIAGIMSGTSLDGIDVAVVDIKGRRIETAAFRTTPYSQSVRSRILSLSTPQDLSRLNFELGELYAKAVTETCRRARISISSLNLIGCHGQTVYHEGVNTLQIGEAAVIAERLRIPVVSDFRTRDIAAGGHGAPLVPFVDDLLLRHPRIPRVALNIGGIANITVLDRKPAIAFDTGPGNMVIDQLATVYSKGRLRYDRDGSIARQGRWNRDLLDWLLEDPYYSAKPPKTAGREQYGRDFVEQMLKTNLPLEDLVAIATALTAATIAQAVHRYAPATKEVIAAGGGVHNKTLMAQIAAFLPSARLTTTAEFGIDPDAKEAVAFAILAWRTWRRQPGNLPSATGARRPVILGKITP
ncbi:MAG TPA: anhydro-N-acetylmuramic acid kinase [Bryobacteraceae bacterium]|nr:anhydro-N-acetylmuramic acid kinase [Bryobacteraceae bacterium]